MCWEKSKWEQGELQLFINCAASGSTLECVSHNVTDKIPCDLLFDAVFRGWDVLWVRTLRSLGRVEHPNQLAPNWKAREGRSESSRWLENWLRDTALTRVQPIAVTLALLNRVKPDAGRGRLFHIELPWALKCDTLGHIKWSSLYKYSTQRVCVCILCIVYNQGFVVACFQEWWQHWQWCQWHRWWWERPRLPPLPASSARRQKGGEKGGKKWGSRTNGTMTVQVLVIQIRQKH